MMNGYNVIVVKMTHYASMHYPVLNKFLFDVRINFYWTSLFLNGGFYLDTNVPQTIYICIFLVATPTIIESVLTGLCVCAV